MFAVICPFIHLNIFYLKMIHVADRSMLCTASSLTISPMVSLSIIRFVILFFFLGILKIFKSNKKNKNYKTSEYLDACISDRPMLWTGPGTCFNVSYACRLNHGRTRVAVTRTEGVMEPQIPLLTSPEDPMTTSADGLSSEKETSQNSSRGPHPDDTSIVSKLEIMNQDDTNLSSQKQSLGLPPLLEHPVIMDVLVSEPCLKEVKSVRTAKTLAKGKWVPKTERAKAFDAKTLSWAAVVGSHPNPPKPLPIVPKWVRSKVSLPEKKKKKRDPLPPFAVTRDPFTRAEEAIRVEVFKRKEELIKLGAAKKDIRAETTALRKKLQGKKEKQDPAERLIAHIAEDGTVTVRSKMMPYKTRKELFHRTNVDERTDAQGNKYSRTGKLKKFSILTKPVPKKKQWSSKFRSDAITSGYSVDYFDSLIREPGPLIHSNMLREKLVKLGYNHKDKALAALKNNYDWTIRHFGKIPSKPYLDALDLIHAKQMFAKMRELPKLKLQKKKFGRKEREGIKNPHSEYHVNEQSFGSFFTTCYRRTISGVSRAMRSCARGTGWTFGKLLGTRLFHYVKDSMSEMWGKLVTEVKRRSQMIYDAIQPYLANLKAAWLCGVGAFIILTGVIMKICGVTLEWKSIFIAALIAIGVDIGYSFLSHLIDLFYATTAVSFSDPLIENAKAVAREFRRAGSTAAMARLAAWKVWLADYGAVALAIIIKLVKPDMDPRSIGLVYQWLPVITWLDIRTPEAFSKALSMQMPYGLCWIGSRCYDNSASKGHTLPCVDPYAEAWSVSGDHWVHPDGRTIPVALRRPSRARETVRGTILNFGTGRRARPARVAAALDASYEPNPADPFWTRAQLSIARGSELVSPSDRMPEAPEDAGGYVAPIPLEDIAATQALPGDVPTIPQPSQSSTDPPLDQQGPDEEMSKSWADVWGDSAAAKLMASFITSVSDLFGTKIAPSAKIMGAALVSWTAVRNASTLLTMLEKAIRFLSLVFKWVYKKIYGYDWDDRNNVETHRRIEKFISDAVTLQAKTANPTWMKDKDLCASIRTLGVEARVMENSAVQRVVPPPLRAQLSLCIKDLLQLEKVAISSLVQPGLRVPPVAVCFMAAPGKGKTQSAVNIAEVFLHKAFTPQQVAENGGLFTRGPTKHWDGYLGQPVIFWDEVCSDKEPVVNAECTTQILSLVSGGTFVAPMAAIDQKAAIPCNPDMVMIATMSATMDASGNYELNSVLTGISDHRAFWRRFTLVEVEDTTPPDLRDWKFNILGTNPEYTLTNERTSMNFKELMTLLYTFHRFRGDPKKRAKDWQDIANEIDMDPTILKQFTKSGCSELSRISTGIWGRPSISAVQPAPSSSSVQPVDQHGLERLYRSPYYDITKRLEQAGATGLYEIKYEDGGFYPVATHPLEDDDLVIIPCPNLPDSKRAELYMPLFMGWIFHNASHLFGVSAGLLYMISAARFKTAGVPVWMKAGLSERYIRFVEGDNEVVPQNYEHGIITAPARTITPRNKQPGYVPVLPPGTQPAHKATVPPPLLPPSEPVIPDVVPQMDEQGPPNGALIATVGNNLWYMCASPEIQGSHALSLGQNDMFVNYHSVTNEFWLRRRKNGKIISYHFSIDRCFFSKVGYDLAHITLPDKDNDGKHWEPMPNITAHMAPDTFDTTPDQVSMIFLSAMMPVQAPVHNVVMGSSIIAGHKRDNLWKGVVDFDTYYGLCGAIWISENPRNYGIFAIHGAGRNHLAVGIPCGLDKQALTSYPADHYAHIPKKSVFQATPINAIKDPEHGIKSERQLALLKPGTKILPDGTTIEHFPVQEALAKMDPPEEKQRRFDSTTDPDGNFRLFYNGVVVQKYGLPWLHEAMQTDGRVFCSQEIAFNGYSEGGVELLAKMDMKKGVGAPLCFKHAGTKKHHWYVKDPDSQAYGWSEQSWEEFNKQVAGEFNIPYIMFLKDELRKVTKPTRSVNMEPSFVTIIMRAALGKFLIALRRCCPFPSAVGINPESIEWEFLLDELEKAFECADADVINMDLSVGIEAPLAWKSMKAMFEEAYKESNIPREQWDHLYFHYKDKALTLHWEYVWGIITRSKKLLHVLHRIYVVFHNLSGTFRTAADNGFGLEFIWSTAFMQMVHTEYPEREWKVFDTIDTPDGPLQLVALMGPPDYGFINHLIKRYLETFKRAEYGDDQLILLLKEAKWWSWKKVTYIARYFGYEITNADKTGTVCAVPTHKLQFLKRGFRRYTLPSGDGVVLAPLVMASIDEIMLWYNATNSWKSQVQSQFDSFIILMSHHPELFVSKVLDMLNRLKRKRADVTPRLNSEPSDPGHRAVRYLPNVHIVLSDLPIPALARSADADGKSIC